MKYAVYITAILLVLFLGACNDNEAEGAAGADEAEEQQEVEEESDEFVSKDVNLGEEIFVEKKEYERLSDKEYELIESNLTKYVDSYFIHAL